MCFECPKIQLVNSERLPILKLLDTPLVTGIKEQIHNIKQSCSANFDTKHSHIQYKPQQSVTAAKAQYTVTVFSSFLDHYFKSFSSIIITYISDSERLKCSPCIKLQVTDS